MTADSLQVHDALDVTSRWNCSSGDVTGVALNAGTCCTGNHRYPLT